MSTQFRTASGQTGTDAYRYEIAQIRNAKRALNRRANELYAAMRAEIPADAASWMSIATDAFPDARLEVDRDGIDRTLDLEWGADTVALDAAEQIVKTLH